MFNHIVNKYFPFRNKSIELAKIQILSKAIYEKSSENERLYNFKNLKNINQLPVFDVSFINNSEKTILLNSIEIYAAFLPVAKAGFYEKPAGILKVTKKYIVKLNYGNSFENGKTVIDLIDPLFILPNRPFRIQIQCDKPIVSFIKVWIAFIFNTDTIITPEFYFNSDYAISGRIVNEI